MTQLSTESKPNPTMICLRGSAALSQFRIEKIQEKLDSLGLNIKHIYAEFWHFAWLDNGADSTLSIAQKNTLEQILTYGPL